MDGRCVRFIRRNYFKRGPTRDRDSGGDDGSSGGGRDNETNGQISPINVLHKKERVFLKIRPVETLGLLGIFETYTLLDDDPHLTRHRGKNSRMPRQRIKKPNRGTIDTEVYIRAANESFKDNAKIREEKSYSSKRPTETISVMNFDASKKENRYPKGQN
ncbi:hypothetical protein EVAR_40478_1 [Eumeta japonica]|uniref:Uncharacterized protein n=1 Tax=Eumeta variegata TaxID=151549 RepID=A0A4C1XZL7_EUMVA|nr:hypothetical protein EVAR_40478_1 [Eumeta japonica]